MGKILELLFCMTIYSIPSSHGATIDVATLLKIQDMYCYGVDKCPQGNTTTTTRGIVQSSSPDPIFSGETFFNLSVAPPPVPGYRCCKSCSCGARTCDLFDTCCLDTLEYIPSMDESRQKIRMTCVDPQLRPRAENMVNAGFTIKMFQKCPFDYQNTSVILACEKKSNQISFSTEIPVTDVTTLYTYQNRYCALCHGVREKNMNLWRVRIECVRGTLQPSSVDAVFDEIFNTETCNLIYEAKHIESYVPMRCYDVITQCNVTGQWQTYDPVIEQACLAYTSVYDLTYKNVYCYMCNTNDDEAKVACPAIPGVRVDVSFVALLHFEPDDEDSNTPSTNTGRCSRHQFHDQLKDICRDMSCLFPKTLQNGACVHLMDTLGGINYGVFLKLTAHNKSTMLDQILTVSDTGRAILSRLNLTDHTSGQISVGVYMTEEMLQSSSQNYYEDILIAYVEVESTILTPLDTRTIDRLMELDGANLVVEKTKAIEYMMDIKVFSFKNDTKNTVYDSKNNKWFVQVTAVMTTIDLPLFSTRPHHEITVTPLFQCTLITLHSSEFNMLRLAYGIRINDLNITLDSEEVIMENYSINSNYSIRMCANKYDFLIKFLPKNLDKNNSCSETELSIKGVLSLVCTVLSISFLIMTMATYLIYKELRSQPGINNIILCASLVVAQGLFQFGSGQACNVSALACKSIGMLVHFSWIFVLFWMNVCCIHMVKVFRQNVVNAAQMVSIKLTLLYLLYAIVGGAAFVAINIVQSSFQDDRNSLGYGGALCYISNSQMVTYLFVIPVGALILFNIMLYIFVVIKINQASNIHSGNRPMTERNYFRIYTKLSTLTGGTWLFGYIYLVWQIDSVEYIFIILNASQGVFLFFSFIFNKRSLKLWTDSLNSFKSTSLPDTHYNVNNPQSLRNDR